LYTRTPIRHQGNDSLFLALEMSLICTAAGIPLHVHAEGLRGTGKTTVMRWARLMAPDITRIKQCVYQCRPDLPHCPNHSDSCSSGTIETESVPMPFIEIGHGAKLGTILGSVDLARLTDPHNPKAALLPGAIPMANRGVVFIDEINRLAETAPEITDVLLSVMGTKPGKIKIEEVGLEPWEIQVSSSVWATSNPDEDPGPLEEIRRQLSDRFDMVVPVHRPSDPLVVQELLLGKYQNASESGRDPKISGSIQQKASSLREVTVPRPIIDYMANLYVEYNIESLRAIESLELTARCFAAMRGKQQVSFDEISTVMPLVLRHRTEPIVLSEILKDLELRKAAGVAFHVNQEPQKSAGGLDVQKLQDTPAAIKVPQTQESYGPKTQADSQAGSNDDPADLPPDPMQPLKPPLPSEYRSDLPNTRTVGNLPGHNGHKPVSWLQRLVWRYHRGANISGFTEHPGLPRQDAGSNGYSPGKASRTQGKPYGTSHLGASEGKRLVPARPVSPPEPARPISDLNWEEILLPFDGKGKQK